MIGALEDGTIVTLKRNFRNRSNGVILETFTPALKLKSTVKLFDTKGTFLINTTVKRNEIWILWANDINDSLQIHFTRHNSQLALVGKDSIIDKFSAIDLPYTLLRMVHPKGLDRVFLLYPKSYQNGIADVKLVEIDTSSTSKATRDFSIALEEEVDMQEATTDGNTFAMLLAKEVKSKVSANGIHYTLVSLPIESGSTPQVQNLYNDTFAVHDALLRADLVNGGICIGGLYGPADSTWSKGYIFDHTTLSNPSFDLQYTPFSIGLKESMQGRNTEQPGIYSLRVGDMVLKSDGGVVLISEEYSVSREVFNDVNFNGISQSNIRYYFYYNNLVLQNLDITGKQSWHRVLRKEQVSLNDNGAFSSYMLWAGPDKLELVYNDLSRKSWNIFYYSISPTGEPTNKILMRGEDANLKMLPRSGKQVSYNTFIIPGTTRKGQMLMKVELPFSNL